MKLDAYGKRIEVIREDGSWVIYELGDGTKRRSNEISIPSEYNHAEIILYLEDILHEAATPDRPKITIVSY